ncbi:BTAD domain-containing putative transcriptional regulator [Plantactinospora mayteni]|uniref:SARP family transcriptional regulator n=1 Tax=Plantactinospora mayteni TaxID=566021 RepID=A0ABQ4EKT2_9ACTN|nr:tetratricopeptide repeat protein [Plantactinospora mayteni]GIG95364.1 SARP family transcriptional regulator [Plantactinospora mayteni]
MGKAGLPGALRGFRERAGLTQQELADRAGLSVGGLRDLEQGRVAAPRPTTLRRLAAGLAMSDVETAELVHLGQRAQPPAYGLRLRVLGPLAVLVNGVGVDPGSVKQRTLLAVLALTPNEPVHLDTLVEVMWAGRPPDGAAGLAQNHVYRLRQRLRSSASPTHPDHLLLASRGGYQLSVTDEQLDLLDFRRLVERARGAHRDGDLSAAYEWYRQATGLWRGAPLADLAGLRVLPEVAALDRERQAVVVEYADTATALGHHDQVLPVLRQATDADPLHEAAHARLMLALAGSGQQAAALGVYEALRRRLADELGADPGPELVGAHRRVLRQEVTRPAGTGPAPVSAHRQLPPDMADFTGREAELRTLWSALPQPGEAGTTLVISAIEGMAGVGKTRLAVHLAHQLVRSGRYVDVQLYVDLHGHADEPPADPATVLASFLHLLGVPGAQIPDGLDARAALYRDRLHGRQALVLLDNAASDDQVLPLLPASPTSLVLVTSRRMLALDGTHTLNLDVFTAQDAHALLGRVAGERRVAADPAAARRVADLCGRLPLAVVLAAHRLRSRPAWTFSDLAARLDAEGSRLGELAVGSRQIRAVFDLSYRALDPADQRLFRLLGLHPGDDFTAESAAALAGVAPPVARRTLERLVDEHLVTPVTADRYRLHDLLRDYASTRARTDDGDGGTGAAVDRILTWYLYAAHAAVRRLLPLNVEVVLDEGARPSHLPVFDADEQAFQWLAAEQTTLVAAVASAVSRGRDDLAWRLPAVLRLYFERRSNWHDWFGTSEIALDAARRAGDRVAEALILSGLGIAYGQLDQTEKAIECLTRSLEIRRAVDDRHGEGRALNNLGVTYGRQGKFHDAIEHLTAALEIRRETASEYDQGMTLGNLGRAYAGAGQHEEAIRCLEEALDLRRRLADPVGVASALFNLGEGLMRAGQHRQALAHLYEARDLYHEKHCRGFEAETLEVLGDCLLLCGESIRARECWQQALEGFDELGHPRAEGLRLRLTQHSG